MDRYLREACEKYLLHKEIDNGILDTSEKRENFKKFCRSLSIEDGVLKYKGRQPNIARTVPTPEQVFEVLDPLHRGSRSKHSCDVRVLGDALSKAGYGFPIGLGGVSSLVVEYVNQFLIIASVLFLL